MAIRPEVGKRYLLVTPRHGKPVLGEYRVLEITGSGTFLRMKDLITGDIIWRRRVLVRVVEVLNG